MFITPKSAYTKGFNNYIYQSQKQGVLDQVVVDKYHTLVDTSATFQPKIRKVGEVIQG